MSDADANANADADADLLDRYFAGDLDEAGELAFRTRMRESDAFLRRLAEQAVFTTMLRTGLTSAAPLASVAPLAANARLSSATPLADTAKPASSDPPLQIRDGDLRHRRGLQFWAGWFLAACVVVGLGIGLGVAWQAERMGEHEPLVLAFSGPVEVTGGGTTLAIQAGVVIRAGQQLQTGSGGIVSLGYADGTRWSVEESTRLEVVAAKNKHLRLDAGKLIGDIAKQPAGRPAQISTPSATVTVLGTVVTLEADALHTIVSVDRGEVEVRRAIDAAQAIVGSGFRVDTADMTLHALTVPRRPRIIEVESLVDAAPADADVHSGQTVRIFREPSPEAGGGSYLAIPGIGTELVLPAPPQAGRLQLWIRHRDEDRQTENLPTFAVVVDGLVVQQFRATGRSQDWTWSMCEIETGVDSRVTIRSLTAGILDRRSETYAYRSVNRIDAISYVVDGQSPPDAPP